MKKNSEPGDDIHIKSFYGPDAVIMISGDQEAFQNHKTRKSNWV